MYSLRSPNFSTSMWYVFTNFPLKTLARRKYLSFVISFIVLFFTIPGFASDDHLLISEAVVTPTASEFIEIANPTGSAIDLDDYYLSDDADYALLPGAFGAGPAPSISSSDFIVQFPSGATIPAGGVLVVAFDGAGFLAAFGSAADFEIKGTDAGTPDMIPTILGSSAGLTNGGENVVLFVWDGASDLVADVDMVNIGTPSVANAIGDKTGVSVDGPDADVIASTYLPDAFTMPQQAGDPGSGTSTKRILLETGSETTGGGNGITGDDETTESITTTWDSPPFSAPDPGVAAIFPPIPEIVITEIMQNPSAVFDSNGEWFEVFNPTAGAIDIDGWTIKDNGTDSHTISNGGPLLVPAGGFLVLARNANSGTNGGVTVDYVYSGITLANGDDEVVLLDDLSTEIDRVEYDGGPNFPDPTGASMSL
ncbi:lamin tail domain-containing protein, partial [candidate division KSB1 bacterium]|nr:lamin tail domain-containing protein [candidate division KSB1 bacterium]